MSAYLRAPGGLADVGVRVPWGPGGLADVGVRIPEGPRGASGRGRPRTDGEGGAIVVKRGSVVNRTACGP